MGLQLPGFLQPIIAEMGLQWPDTDEEALFTIGRAFYENSASAAGTHADCLGDLEELAAGQLGPGIAQFKLFAARLSTAPGNHQDVARVAAVLLGADHVTAAGIVLTTKLRIIAELSAHAAQKAVIVAMMADAPKVAAALQEYANITKEITLKVEAIIEQATEALTELNQIAAEVIDRYTSVALPVLRGRTMDNERDDHDGAPVLPAGIDPNDDYRKQLVDDQDSPYAGHADWVPGNPPGRSTQPVLGQAEGGGTWQEVGPAFGAAGQAYQAYATGVSHPGPGGKALELVIEGTPNPAGKVKIEGYNPAGERAQDSPQVFIDAKKGYSKITTAVPGQWMQREALAEANRQVDALDSTPEAQGAVIEWHVSDPKGAEGLRELFAQDPKLAHRVLVFYTPER